MATATPAVSPKSLDRTVGSEIRRLFPRGLLYSSTKGDTVLNWSVPPLFPADLFAAAGHLLEASGAYQFIVAPFSENGRSAKMDYNGPTCAPTQQELDRWTAIGRRLAVDWRHDEDVTRLWKQIWRDRNQRLVRTLSGKTQPKWWKAAHALLVISDEASTGVGYEIPAPTDEIDLASPGALRWANYLTAKRLAEQTLRRLIPASDPSHNGTLHLSRHVALDSVAQDTSRDVVRVLPKGRTASFGCTFRTLSHNLALMAPHGGSNSYWHQPRTFEDVTAHKGENLNLLLIPFPYGIPEGCFVGELSQVGDPSDKWGRFSVDQKWLRPAGMTKAKALHSLVGFIDELVGEAEKSTGKEVHGVVLPEVALDWDIYDALARTLLVKRPAVELLMSGVSRDCNGTAGNLVTTSLFHSIEGTQFVETHSRMKHHRWCLDGDQVRGYGLEKELDPEALWWEHLEVEERVLNIDVLRQSTITAVICEDLARVDPGVASLRLLGPNLVVALLMDGPQLKNRWPAQYAGTLAQDPGSSVLSLTSLGLIRRSNLTYKKEGRVIAFWKNYPERPTSTKPQWMELDLGASSQAIMLSLEGKTAKESTLDGRPNTDAIAWTYDTHHQVGFSESELDNRGWRWIVDEA